MRGDSGGACRIDPAGKVGSAVPRAGLWPAPPPLPLPTRGRGLESWNHASANSAIYVHGGGACPVDPDSAVRVTFRNGVSARHASPARQLHWGHRGRDDVWDIVAYESLAGAGRGRR
jgi:hypothetical protein